MYTRKVRGRAILIAAWGLPVAGCGALFGMDFYSLRPDSEELSGVPDGSAFVDASTGDADGGAWPKLGAARLLAVNQREIQDIVSDASHVMWINRSGSTIVRIPKSLEAPLDGEPKRDGGSAVWADARPTWLVAGPEAFYFGLSAPASPPVYAMNRLSLQPTRLTSAWVGTFVGVDAQHLYWTWGANPNRGLNRVSITSTSQPTEHLVEAGGASRIAVTQRWVVWALIDSVRAYSKLTSNVHLVAGRGPTCLAADETYAYWCSPSGLFRTRLADTQPIPEAGPLPTPPPFETLAENEDGPIGAEMFGPDIYWMTQNGSPRRIAREGGNAVTIGEAVVGAKTFHVDASGLIVGTQSGEVWLVPFLF